MQGTWVRFLGQEDPLEKEWQPTPVFLPGESPWTEEPGRLQSMRYQESDTTERLNHHYHQALFYTRGLKEKWSTTSGLNWDPYIMFSSYILPPHRFVLATAAYRCILRARPIHPTSFGFCIIANTLWMYPWSLWGEDLDRKYSFFSKQTIPGTLKTVHQRALRQARTCDPWLQCLHLDKCLLEQQIQRNHKGLKVTVCFQLGQSMNGKI